MRNKRRGRPSVSAIAKKSTRKDLSTEKSRTSRKDSSVESVVQSANMRYHFRQGTSRNDSSVDNVAQPNNTRYQFRQRSSHGSVQGTSHSTSKSFESELSSDENDEDVDISIETLKNLFTDQIIDEIKQLSPGARLMAMANYIIDNPEQFRTKKKKKIQIPDEQLEPTFISLNSALSRDANFRPKLLDAFFDDFRDHYTLHFSRIHSSIYDKEMCYRLLHQHFPSCRSQLIECLVEDFAGRYSTAAWICFFVESNLGYLVRNFFMTVEQRSWAIMSRPMPIPRRPRHNWIPNPNEGSLADSIEEFTKVLKRFRNDYKQLFRENEDRLLPVRFF
ncbi:hypothetical protein ACQ4LE_002858 [Meloidogyne hapla]|uniref:Uncharacterized protein n=1 Tax=Meloidogyne hapla TaxID=6305 RepID=A0A1I8C2I1_MELHA